MTLLQTIPNLQRTRLAVVEVEQRTKTTEEEVVVVVVEVELLMRWELVPVWWLVVLLPMVPNSYRRHPKQPVWAQAPHQ